VRSREGWLAVMMALIAGYVDAIGDPSWTVRPRRAP
jgi:hypothetical protein